MTRQEVIEIHDNGFRGVSESADGLSVTGAYGKTKPVITRIWERQGRSTTPVGAMLGIYLAEVFTAL